jgi:hypothetical protein
VTAGSAWRGWGALGGLLCCAPGAGGRGSRGLVEGRDILFLGPRVGHVGADVRAPPAPAWMLMFW